MIIYVYALGMVYMTMIFSYCLNVLITELPLDDRYQRLKKHFTWKRFITLPHYPLVHLMSKQLRKRKPRVRLRHWLVYCIAFGLILVHITGNTIIHPVLHFTIFSILVISFFTDIEHQIIPNEMSFLLVGIGIIYMFVQNTVIESLMGVGITIAVFSIFSLILRIATTSNTFGAGDIKLCLGIALVWGWKVTVIMLYFTFLTSGIMGAYCLWVLKRNKNSCYAFAPYIILGLIIALVYTDSIFAYYYPWTYNAFEILAPK